MPTVYSLSVTDCLRRLLRDTYACPPQQLPVRAAMPKPNNHLAATPVQCDLLRSTRNRIGEWNVYRQAVNRSASRIGGNTASYRAWAS
jgi:hypothetical protein